MSSLDWAAQLGALCRFTTAWPADNPYCWSAAELAGLIASCERWHSRWENKSAEKKKECAKQREEFHAFWLAAYYLGLVDVYDRPAS
jgi:hypothetical protein